MTNHERLILDRQLDPETRRADARRELRVALERDPREIPSKYFYDDTGSELFERITELPEYYLTRVETAMLRDLAPGLIERTGARELLELGSGYSIKTELLLDSVCERSPEARYLAIDVAETALRAAAARLLPRYPGVRMHGIVADFTRPLVGIPNGDSRLFAFLGSTIGNFAQPEATALLRSIAEAMTPEDHFLLGVDLFKDLITMEDAYNDADGVTAEFNRNILNVVNEHLQCWFDPANFDHVAFYDDLNCWIEMRLRTRHPVMLRIFAFDDERPYVLDLSRGEEIRTEISCKYTREQVDTMLRAAGLEPLEWHAAPNDFFGLALARRLPRDAAPTDR